MSLVLKNISDGEIPESSRKYTQLLDPATSILDQMKRNGDESCAWLNSLPDALCNEPYAPGKWSIKDTVCHLSDDERIYVYRALRYARGDRTERAGFDEKLFAENAGANRRAMRDLLDEFLSVRQATLTFFKGLDESSLVRRGSFEDREFSVRGLAFHLAGHELHHMNILRSFVETRRKA